jgi:hypothetical protein
LRISSSIAAKICSDLSDARSAGARTQLDQACIHARKEVGADEDREHGGACHQRGGDRRRGDATAQDAREQPAA